VDGKVIADPKVVTAFNETHIAQMIGYMNITGLDVAILLNFKNAKLEWKRLLSMIVRYPWFPILSAVSA